MTKFQIIYIFAAFFSFPPNIVKLAEGKNNITFPEPKFSLYLGGIPKNVPLSCVDAEEDKNLKVLIDENYGGIRKPRSLPESNQSYVEPERLEDWEALALGRMLVEVVEKEMNGCNIVIIFDDYYDQDNILAPLLRLDASKEIFRSVDGLLWMDRGGCSGYIMLLSNPQSLFNLTDSEPLLWDYRGRFLLVLPSRSDVEQVVRSKKGRKTENIAGAVKSGAGTWQLYISELYTGEGVILASTWRVKQRGGQFSAPLRLYPEKLVDLQGTTLKAVTFEWAPSVFYYRSRNGSVLFRYGTDIGVLETLTKVLNFTVQYQEPPRGERWGREENGVWSGMMGKLHRDEVDIGLVDLYVTIIRVGILDYTAPYDSELSCFMARTEPPLPRWQALAYPFQQDTWMAILIGLVVAGPVLCLLARGVAKCGENEVSSLESLSASWYYTLGLHACEAQVILPKAQSTRIFISFLWLYTMTLTIAYSTNLTAYLLVSKAPATMETIRELHASGLEVSGVGKFYGDALGYASDPYLQSLEQRFESYDEAQDIFPRVLSGRAVMIQNSPFLEFVAATKYNTRGRARMRLMKECFAPFNIAMAVQRHSALKRKFDQVIGWVVAAGLVRHSFLNSLRLYARNAKELAEVEEEEKSDVEGNNVDVEDVDKVEVEMEGVTSLSLEHLQGIFFIISIGWLMSALIFIVELVV